MWVTIVIIILLISTGYRTKSFKEEAVIRNFERLAPLYIVNFLINKLFELQKLNLCPCDVKLNSLRSRLRKVQEIKEKLILQNYNKQYKCYDAIMWLERPEKDSW